MATPLQYRCLENPMDRGAWLTAVHRITQNLDLEFLEWLGENGIPFAIIFTKADKLGHGKVKTNVRNYLQKLEEQWETLPPYFISSSEDRTGRDEILNYIDEINKSQNE